MTNPLPSEASINKLVGHKFPGGSYTIAHWENFLLTECTGAEPLPDNLAHPVALFHVPILGAGTSIAEMFSLGQAEPGASIRIESYDWEFYKPLQEERAYDVSGVITSAERRQGRKRTFDRIQFQFDLHDEESDDPVARTIVTWLYRRSTQ